jgi:hypothetical protein
MPERLVTLESRPSERTERLDEALTRQARLFGDARTQRAKLGVQRKALECGAVEDRGRQRETRRQREVEREQRAEEARQRQARVREERADFDRSAKGVRVRNRPVSAQSEPSWSPHLPLSWGQKAVHLPLAPDDRCPGKSSRIPLRTRSWKDRSRIDSRAVTRRRRGPWPNPQRAWLRRAPGWSLAERRSNTEWPWPCLAPGQDPRSTSPTR